MDHDKVIKRALPKLPHRLRVAFAYACAERARHVYEASVEDADFFFDALAFAWYFVIDEPFDADEMAKAMQEVQNLHDRLVENEETGYETDALRSLLGAMGSVTDPTTESAEDAAFFALDAVGNTASTDENTELAQQEEEKFQRAVLKILESWKQDSIDVDAFEPIGWTEEDYWPKPSWFDRWVEGDESW